MNEAAPQERHRPEIPSLPHMPKIESSDSLDHRDHQLGPEMTREPLKEMVQIELLIKSIDTLHITDERKVKLCWYVQDTTFETEAKAFQPESHQVKYFQ